MVAALVVDYRDTRALASATPEELKDRLEAHMLKVDYEGEVNTPEAIDKLVEKILFWAQIAARNDSTTQAYRAVLERYDPNRLVKSTA